MIETRRKHLAKLAMAAPLALLSQDRLWGQSKSASKATPPIYYDADGLIVHKGMDGGDTAQREGWYWFGVWIRKNVLSDPWTVPRQLSFQQVIGMLEPARDGVFYRHPKLKPWNNPYDKEFGFSRDQMIPLVAAMGVWGQTDSLRRLWNALPQDRVGGTKHTFNGEWQTVLGVRTVYTGDVVGPSTINHFRRAWGEDPIPASDGNGVGGEAELEANVALRLKAGLGDKDDTGDDLNLIVMLLMSLLRFKTPASSRATNVYAKNRPVTYGSFLGSYRSKYGLDLNVTAAEVRRRLDVGIESGWKTDASRVLGAVRWYHRQEVGANPQLADLYDPIVRAFLE